MAGENLISVTKDKCVREKKCSPSLLRWPIFNLLESELLTEIRIAMVYGKIGNEALIVTKNDMVYAVGQNEDGCLGTGDTHRTIHAIPVVRLHQKKIKTFACGAKPYVLALTEEGEVYSWGCNENYQLGNGSSHPNPFPTCVNFELLGNDFVVDVACGSQHSLALTNTGALYLWGSNSMGQLGMSEKAYENLPKKLKSTSQCGAIVSIACGQYFNMAINQNGHLYGWGSNGVGQLGIGSVHEKILGPTAVKVPGVIVKVVCGYTHTLALNNQGVLYAWGANDSGQLGIPGCNKSCTPIMVSHPEMKLVVDIAASFYCDISVALEGHGRVFMWGHCAGQNISTPTLVSCDLMHDVFALYASHRVMHKPLILDADDSTSVTESLAMAFDDESTSDLTIQVEDKSIYVHKSILKIRSQYFRNMLQGHWMENHQKILQHEEFSYNVYRAYLKYLYTDELSLPVEDAWKLLDLANAYCEEYLKTIAAQIIRRGITCDNAALLYTTAVLYSIKELEEFCFKFILNNMTAVIQGSSFSELDESTMKKLFSQAAEARAFKT